MTFRRRLGVLATAVSGLLAAALLLSAPAFAWSSQLSEVHSRCPSNPRPDQTRISLTLTPFQGHEGGSVSVAYSINGGDQQQVPDGGLFNQEGKKQDTFTAGDGSLKLHFFVPSPHTEGRIHLFVTTAFNDLPEGETVPVAEADVKLVVCETAETTTTTSTTTPPDTTPTTVITPTTVVASPTTAITPTTVVASPTTAAGAGALGATTTTSGGGSLPFTGANAMPMVIAAMVLVLGGGGLVIASRLRGRHAK